MQCAATQVRGRVTDCRDSTPLDGADVQLTTHASGSAWEPEQTGSDGAYAFEVGHNQDVLPVTLTAAKHGFRTTQKVFPSMPSGASDVCLQPTMR
jgi:hypothetical protein